ncbi:MAG: hypothetical protein IT559_07155 [Alphaproteobacteria bacterium]|nr:hypothetical protein [Alphaproteobacteria bacterium]
MKLLKPVNFVIFAMVALSGAALLHTSQNVQRVEGDLRSLEASVQRENEKVRLLRAEWENLNRPERLERLAREFLDLAAPAPETLVREDFVLPAVPEDEAESVFMEEAAPPPPVVRDVAYAPERKSARALPQKAVPPEKLPAAKAEKTFGELLGELSERRPQ